MSGNPISKKMEKEQVHNYVATCKRRPPTRHSMDGISRVVKYTTRTFKIKSSFSREKIVCGWFASDHFVLIENVYNDLIMSYVIYSLRNS